MQLVAPTGCHLGNDHIIIMFHAQTPPLLTHREADAVNLPKTSLRLRPKHHLEKRF